MQKEQLIKDALQLGPFSPEAAEEYARISDELVLKLNSKLMQRSDLQDILGNATIDLMKDNHSNHARFITSIMKNFSAETLTETILWVFRAYKSRGFTSAYWAVQINAWINLLQEHLSEKAFAQIFPLYNWILVNIPAFDHIAATQFGGQAQSITESDK